MAERLKYPFSREQTHGTVSRASRSVPARLSHLHQGYQDKRRLLDVVTMREKARLKELYGLGNRDLPAYKHKQEIVDIVENYKACIIGGATGSGKSTQVPQFLYEAGYDKIYVMVPRRVIADGLYDRICEEMSGQLSEEELENAIGVMHGERSETHEDNRIVIMTPNTFLRAGNEIEQQHGDKKVAIVADEMHEANVYTEIAAGVGLKSVETHDNWRFIAASATHNEAVLQRPLGKVNDGIAPSLKIEGRPFELEQHECPDDTVMQAYAKYGGEAEKSMIFTSGKAEIDHIIDKTRHELELQEKGSSHKVVFRKLHSELTEREISHINDPVSDGYRLVIVSSPAGMSGITIPGVTHVFSDGTINREELDDDDVSGLSREYLSQAGITQQFGRAGRDVPGGKGYLCQPTMIEEDKIRDKGQEVEELAMPYKPYHKRDKFEPAEIYSTNLAGIILSVANLDMEFAEVNEYLPHRVQEVSITKAKQQLMRLGALDHDGKITDIGRQMSQYQIRPELSRGIVEAMRGKRPILHLARIAIVAAAVGAGGVQDFRDKRSREWEKLLDESTTDDMVAQYDIVTALPTGDPDQDVNFIAGHDLSYKRISQTQKVARKIMRTLGIEPRNVVHAPMNYQEAQAIRDDLTAGMIDLIYKYTRKERTTTQYRNIHSDEPDRSRALSDRSITPKDTQLLAGFPRWFKKTRRSKSKAVERVKHDVVEQTMPVDPEVVGRHATAAGLLSYNAVGRVKDGDMIKTEVQPMFGSLKVGTTERHVTDRMIPEEAQATLVQWVLNEPGYNQNAFRDLAVELERYTKTIPEDTLQKYLKSDAPTEMVTQKSITDLIKLYAERTTSKSEIDRLLGAHMYSKNIGIEQYFEQPNREYLEQCSIPSIVIDGQYLKVQYLADDERTPYVAIDPRRRELLGAVRRADKSQLTLPDGRLIHVKTGGKFVSPYDV